MTTEVHEGAALDVALERLGLAGSRGPSPWTVEPSSAWQLGIEFARDALPRVVEELRTLRIVTLGRLRLPVQLDDAHLEADSASIGLALLGAVSPPAIEAATEVRYVSRMTTGPQASQRTRHLATLSQFLIEESQLWRLAASAGARSHEIPYAFRRRAMEWLWEPEAHRHRRRTPAGASGAYALCLRCGTHLYRQGNRRRRGVEVVEDEVRGPTEVRCPSCMKEPNREWPDHAIAPAGSGTWWLSCETEDCAGVFEGRRQRKHCDAHDRSRMSPAARPASGAV